LLCCAGLFWVQKRRAYAESLAADLERERHDADEQTKHSQMLSESEVRFRTLIEDAPLAIAILRGGYFVYSNPRYRNLHGYLAEDDLTGLPWSAMISPESREILHEQEALITADSPIEQIFEAQGLSKEGRLAPVFKTTARVELVDGPATLVFAQDISAQKHAESALLQARDAAEAANRSKADFLANMSHEIRSPLNAILGLAYLLEQARLELDAHGMVRKIVASGRMLLSIINDILDVSKIEAGHLVIEHAPFRLNDVIDNLAVTMGLAVADKNIHLIIQPIPAGISSVRGDALRLEQVLNNLTSNAIKFTHVGQVELRISLVSRDEENIMLRIAVHDTGIGIPIELQSDVFSAFTQADSSTTRRFGGTGLGLTICRQLVSLMGGEIGVNSTLGQGSEFWFTVPLQLIPSTAFSSPDMVRLDALIADDSEIALRAVTDTAEGLGWQVSAVRSGEAVLAQLLERRDGKLPDVVILDWKMPGMDGLATVRAIRERTTEDACPIVIMATAYSLPDLASRPGAELVDAFLSKPVTSSTLYNATVEAQRKREASVDMPNAIRKSTTPSLAGVRVLIVDDSEINRDVAQRILDAQGAISSLAVDGKAALDWLLAHPDDVDLVLMDVQMPVMDGIEATRQLRLMPQFNDLPIVALTAGAFKEQQDAARAAGMTHFISKPFDVPSTVALIQRIRRKQTNADGDACIPVDETQAGHSNVEPSSEFSVIDINRGLKIWSEVQTYRDYLRRFASSYGSAVEEINASLAANDRQAAAMLAHKLAGVAANLALPDTQRLATETERTLSTGYDSTFVLARLGDALEQAIMAIERFAPRAAAQASTSSPAMGDEISLESQAALKVLFVELLEALDQDSPAPVKPVLAKLLTALQPQELTGIQECVRDFDFRRAETTTIRLALDHGIILEG
jgi:PAS domain S-box-containing protein